MENIIIDIQVFVIVLEKLKLVQFLQFCWLGKS